MKIYLIGMPGSGKTTLGRQLAENLNLNFIDLDQEIEKKENASIPEVFSTKGEDYFRKVEAESLRVFAGSNESFIMATGGGAPCFYNGIETLNLTGISIFLDVSVDELVKRLSKKTDRPLLQNQTLAELRRKIELLKENRESIYRRASLVIKNPDLNTILKRLMAKK